MAGVEYAHEPGTKSTAGGRPKKVFDCEEAVRLRRRGMSVRAVAQQLGDWIGDCSAGVEELHSPN
jgi:hypothetical protein